MLRLQHRRHPEYYIENTVTVDESSISIHNVHMDFRLDLSQLAFLLDTPQGLMFMLPQTRVLCWLPQRLFEGNDYKQTIIGYASVNKVLVKSMK